MSGLSNRLQAVCERVLVGLPVADIGADHGAVSCALVGAGRVPRAIAIDIAQGPIARLHEAVKRCRLEGHVDIRQGDGLAPLAPNEVSTIVICGMGGGTIQRILEVGLPRLPSVERLVLSAHTEVPQLRRALVGMGWSDQDGCWLADRGHHYAVAAWEKGQSEWSEADFRWGRSARSLGEHGLVAYLRWERERLSQAYVSARAGRGEHDPDVVALMQALTQIDGELAHLS